MRTRYAARVFGAAGIFNIALGTAAFVAPDLTARLLGIALPQSPLFMDLSMWLVLVLGVGYCLTAINPDRNRDLMLISGLGKLFVLPLMLSAWRRGDIGLSGVAAGSVDFALALLFFDVRRRLKTARTSAG
ncbi:MAG TPA: hypothetical protein VEM57_03160 [Candidatus Binatus sp.]|nr:hypothetical protein [Candidatus Binatus sp.]